MNLLSIEIYSPWCLPCHATCGMEGKGVLDMSLTGSSNTCLCLPIFFLDRRWGT